MSTHARATFKIDGWDEDAYVEDERGASSRARA